MTELSSLISFMIITLMMVLDGQQAGEKQASTLQSLYYRLFLLLFIHLDAVIHFCQEPDFFSLPSV